LHATADNQLDGPYLATLGLTHRVAAWRLIAQNPESRQTLAPV